MRKEFSDRIDISGSKKHVEEAERALNTLNLDEMSEREARISIQDLIEDEKLKASILFEGNTVWDKEKILRNVRRIVKEGVLGHAGYIRVGSILRMPSYAGEDSKPILTNYFYKFLHLTCGSIAHYNKAGWIAEYPSVEHLREFFKENEYGKKVLDDLPDWKTDAIRIVEEIEKLLKVNTPKLETF